MTTQQNCPDCGAGVGQPHKINCDIERCSICGQQRIGCNCEDHDPGRSRWTGVFPLLKNVAESLRLSKDERIAAKPQQCYYNGVKAIIHCPEYCVATYVEGYAQLEDGVLIEHGWLERDGEIIDPTLPSEAISYFPGLRFEGEPGISEAIRLPKPDWAEDLPFFYRFGWGGKDSPEFMAAWDAALRCCNATIAEGTP